MASVNNDIYHTLGDRWYDASDDPVALLRAESKLRGPWIAERTPPASRVLDIGCGAGFLTNYLSELGHDVTGLDLAENALAVAAARDVTKRVTYQTGNAYALPFTDGAFDVVCSMDMLEHVDDPGKVIAEAARVLRPGGKFFFYTFNRTWISYLLAVKGIEWVVRNTPKHLHVYHLLLKPSEVAAFCRRERLDVKGFQGVAPVVWSKAFGELLFTGRVPPDFRFHFVKSLSVGYLGEATKQ